MEPLAHLVNKSSLNTDDETVNFSLRDGGFRAFP